MKTNLNFYSLLRQCRPLRCPSQRTPRPFSIYARRPYTVPLQPSRPQIRRAAFTTSPTTIPPHSEDSPPKSASSSSTPLAIHQDSHSPEEPPEPIKRPCYQLTFTCKPCQKRSSHEVSKQGYHYGTVLITCPNCKNRHVISDHLKIFADTSFTLEDLMREKGELVKRGSLRENGDIEFWDEKGQVPD